MKRHVRKHRISLTLLFTVVVFCILLITLLLAAALSYLLAHFNVTSFLGIRLDSGTGLVVFMFFVSLIAGIIITVLTSRIPLNPFNRIINAMNCLAAGDFKARLEFGRLLRDRSAFAELSRSFNTMARELEHTEMLRGDFVNNFSHEFKTPIVSIAGFASLLRRGELSPEQQREYLAIIEEESLRLSSMATNVLALTKVENQTILTDVSTFNLSEQLRSCVLLLEEHWTRKGISPDLEFEEYTISANEELLRQVWINLLDNAIKFSPPTGEILLRVADSGPRLSVSVTNYGSDIPPDKLDKIWNKFYQADESHSSPGNGVGLAIVRYVAELHGGSAAVQSGNGRTTFTVELPKQQ